MRTSTHFAALNLMPTGYFCARPYLLDSTEEEVAEIAAGKNEERRVVVYYAMAALAHRLAQWEPAGRC